LKLGERRESLAATTSLDLALLNIYRALDKNDNGLLLPFGDPSEGNIRAGASESVASATKNGLQFAYKLAAPSGRSAPPQR
jgi:hypothetical protein